MSRFLVRSLAAFAAASAIHAQSFAALPHEGRHVHGWPETVAFGSLQPVVARLCRFDAASGLDAVLLRAQEAGLGEAARGVFVMRDVGRAHACVPLGAAIDFVVVRCQQGEQAVLTLSAEGTLRLHRWPANQLLPTAQVLGAWPGFRRLAAVPAGTSTELFGFDSTGIRVRRATWSGSQLGPSSLVFVPPNVDSILGMDWNHDGVLELVLGTPGSTFVQGWNLAPLASLPTAPTSSVVTTASCVSHADGAGDQLVTVAWDGAQSAISWANATTSGTLLLGPCAIGAMSTYDRDGDGDEDVLLGDADHNLVHVLLREPTGYTHTVAPLVVGEAAPDAGIGALAGGDVDGDGDGDVLAWNRGTLRVHTWFDAARGGQRLREVHGDVFGATIGSAVQLPVTVGLPAGLPQLQPEASAFRLRFDGWLVDPLSGFVLPQRAVSHEVAIDPAQAEVATTLAFGLPAPFLGMFHLQLQAGVVAITAGGERRALPTTLVHLTNDPQREAAIRGTVALELTGGLGGEGQGNQGKGDGGGDGNILGTKTGKHEIGVPPE